jgi:uncharacterized protein
MQPVAKQIFVNLPVRDLDISKQFFAALGFRLNPQFTNENAACMIIGENIYAMLLVEKFFRGFTTKPVADATKATGAITALAVESRAKVDEIAGKALTSGGEFHREPQDHGWMYGRSFQDPDGHVWEVLYMDESRLPPAPA